jgi:small-conductance mechanosensitive channel
LFNLVANAMTFPEIAHSFKAYLPGLLAAVPAVVLILIGAFVLNRLINRVLVFLARRSRLTEADVRPVGALLHWIVRLLAVILILSTVGFQIGGIWGMISTVLGLVAIGFVAVWSLISHTTATVLILFTRPFSIGDDIEFPGEPVGGRVADINFFFTTLIDHEGQLLQIPNNLFFQKSCKRRRNIPPLSLAAQLNAEDRADVPLPPRPAAPPADNRRKEPDPLLMMPDPRSITPPSNAKQG